jgi:hypothetical protein
MHDNPPHVLNSLVDVQLDASSREDLSSDASGRYCASVHFQSVSVYCVLAEPPPTCAVTLRVDDNDNGAIGGAICDCRKHVRKDRVA